MEAFAENKWYNIRRIAENAMYIWEQSPWPRFTWSYEVLAIRLANIHRKQGRLLGQMESLGFRAQQQACVETLTQDVVKTSEIEGEILDARQVRSSIRRKLGLMQAGMGNKDRAIEGVVDMTLDATRNAGALLTTERLYDWHRKLFPSKRRGWHEISVGSWRNDSSGPMVIVSGPQGKQRIHFQAPPANRLDDEMKTFLEWFEGSPGIDWILKSTVAHLWFVTIHPFDDGNGRIARAISDMALARSDESPQRFYSMSARIRIERKKYYDTLERTSRGSLDVTPWIEWFLDCLSAAIDDAHTGIDRVLQKQHFWSNLDELEITERQRKVLNKLLDEAKTSLKTSDYSRIAKCSQDTAHRDMLELVSLGLLSKDSAGGRSTRYVLTRRL